MKTERRGQSRIREGRRIVELFSIECTTCQQRLNVRDESAIGEIQICPKCGSMVLVEAPSDWQGKASDEPAPTSPVPPPPVAEDESDEAASGPGETAVASRQTPAAPPVIVGGDESPTPSQEADTVDGPIELDAAQAETGAAADTEPESVAADEPPFHDGPVAQPDSPSAGPAEPVLPTDDWTSEATQQRRQWLLVGGAAIVGIVLAVGLVGLLASRRSRPEPDDPVANGKPGTETPRDTDDNTPHEPPEDDEIGDETEGKPPTAKDDESDGGTEYLDKPSDPPAAPDDPSKPEAEPVEDPESHMPEPKTKPEQEKSSNGDDKDKLLLKPVDDKPDATAMDTAALAKTLGALAPLTDEQPYTSPQLGEASPKEAAPKLDPAALPLQGPSAPRPEPREVNVAERLKDEIPGIEFSDTPLIDFLRFVTDFSTIPITLDPDALALVSATPQTLINVKQSNTNVAKLLSDVLGSIHLGYVRADGHLLVTRPPPADGQLLAHSYPAADLVGEDPRELARLADIIVEMVAPGSWEENGCVGIVRQKVPSLEFKHRDVEKFRALVFCDRLRVARGLPPQSNFNRELFKLEPRLSQAEQRLATPVTINYVQPTLFVRILDRLGKEAGLQIIVDWRAVAELGWTPEGEATISANNEPIGQALAKMLLPMDLTYRVVNANTVQITSPTALIARLDIEFYPIEKALLPQETPEEFLQHVRKQLGEEGLRDIGATIHLDTPSKHLIAALPQPWHRELADLLNHRQSKPVAGPQKTPPP